MSDLAATAVALYPPTVPSATAAPTPEWYPRGKDDRTVISRRLKLTLSGQGTATDKITASALGFQYLLSTDNLWDAANSKGYPAVVDPVNNIIILLDGAAAPAPTPVTSSAAYILVTGIVKQPGQA